MPLDYLIKTLQRKTQREKTLAKEKEYNQHISFRVLSTYSPSWVHRSSIVNWKDPYIDVCQYYEQSSGMSKLSQMNSILFLIVLWFGSERYHVSVFPINCGFGQVQFVKYIKVSIAQTYGTSRPSAICKIHQIINCTNVWYFKTINFFILFLRAKIVFLNIN